MPVQGIQGKPTAAWMPDACLNPEGQVLGKSQFVGFRRVSLPPCNIFFALVKSSPNIIKRSLNPKDEEGKHQDLFPHWKELLQKDPSQWRLRGF